MRIAITRGIGPSFGRCELTHLPREPIDVPRAREQHRSYEQILADLGCTVRRLRPDPALPDGVFVEDTAIVLDELAILARPGAASRRPEVATVAEALEAYRPLWRIEPPATLDGGDVLRVGRTLYVGQSGRTDAAAARQVEALVAPHGYRVVPIPVAGCLHLKSAVTQVGKRLLLCQTRWVDVAAFEGLECVEPDPAEPFAANVLRIAGEVIVAAAYPRTRERLERRGVRVRGVDVSEIAKAEGGLTCCSLILAG